MGTKCISLCIIMILPLFLLFLYWKLEMYYDKSIEFKFVNKIRFESISIGENQFIGNQLGGDGVSGVGVNQLSGVDLTQPTGVYLTQQTEVDSTRPTGIHLSQPTGIHSTQPTGIHLSQPPSTHKNQLPNSIPHTTTNSIITLPSSWNSTDKRFEGVTVRKFVGFTEVPFSLFDPYVFKQTNDTDVTVVAVSTPTRLFYIPYLLDRWKGRYCIVMYLRQNEVERTISAYLKLNNTSRLTIVFYSYNHRNMYGRDFPVNLLRNVGIRQVETSHFLMLDMDMWLNEDMYDAIKQIPRELMNKENNLFIIPTIFLNKVRHLKECSSFNDCVIKATKKLPHSKADIKECMKSEDCFLGKSKIVTHKYTSPEWLNLPSSSAVVKFRCFLNYEQEPYYIVKYTPSTAVYDEDFINYGFNKIQYFEYWRLKGAKFYLIAQSFAVDIPHPDSNFRRAYVSKYTGKRISGMEMLFKKVRSQYVKQFEGVRGIGLCRKAKNQYIIV